MAKVIITKDDKRNFNSTKNGAKKYLWMHIGMIVDFLASVGICFLSIFSYRIRPQWMFFTLLYIFVIIIVLGGEFIGTYHGALEQYVLHKKEKKELEYMDI